MWQFVNCEVAVVSKHKFMTINLRDLLIYMTVNQKTLGRRTRSRLLMVKIVVIMRIVGPVVRIVEDTSEKKKLL